MNQSARIRGRWLALIIGLAVSTHANIASAQAGVSVQVPQGCGSKDQFVAELIALKHSEAAIEALELALEIRANDASFVLTLSDNNGTREFKDPVCTTLFRTAVVIAAASMPDESGPEPIAESVSPAASTPSPTPEPVAQQPEPTKLAQQPIETTPSSPAPRPTMIAPMMQSDEKVVESSERSAPLDVGPELHVGAGAVLGTTAKIALAAEGGVAIGINRWALSLLARYLPESTTSAEGARMRAEVWGGRVAAGYDITPKVRCGLGISAYRIAAEAIGIRHPAEDSVWFAAPELEASVEAVRWGMWRGEVALQGRIALNTPQFELAPDRSVVFAVPRVGASGYFRIKWAP